MCCCGGATLFGTILQYTFILTLYSRNVNKFGFVIGLIIAIGAMLVIPIPIAHVAKASTCSVSSSKHGNSASFSSTFSGACSSGGAIRGSGTGITGIISASGGSQSSCDSKSVSTTPSSVRGELHNNNGAVSCSSHSP
jgi:hypothetical protein